jgi:hypothetical protein
MRIALKLIWLLLMLISVGATALYVQGLRRDLRVGEPAIDLDLTKRSELLSTTFRVRRSAAHTVYLTSVNHTPPYGIPFEGILHVRVLNPVGGPVFDQRYQPGSSGHKRPDNMEWTQLARLQLPATGRRTWRLEARVVQPDARFAGVASRVLVREERDDPGMGGLVNYVMPIPAVAFGLFALLIGAVIAKRKEGRWPLGISILYLMACLAALIGA